MVLVTQGPQFHLNPHVQRDIAITARARRVCFLTLGMEGDPLLAGGAPTLSASLGRGMHPYSAHRPSRVRFGALLSPGLTCSGQYRSVGLQWSAMASSRPEQAASST